MNRKDMADKRHKSGYNCAQAVACSFADKAGVDETLLFRACEGFGLGMGCMDGNCGALSGAILLAGLKNSCGDLKNPSSKQETYRLSKEIYRRFVEKTGGSVCKELKGMGTGKILCSCPDCIKAGVETVEEVLGM